MVPTLQNTGRSGTKRTSAHVGHLARDAKNAQKSAPRPLEQGFLPRAPENYLLERSGLDFGGVWSPIGRLLGGAGALLTPSWVPLGVFWVPLGRSWAPLGRIWMRLGAPRLDFQGFRVPPSHVFGRSGLNFELGFRIQCVYCCMQPSMAFTVRFSSPPCSAAVRALCAHGIGARSPKTDKMRSKSGVKKKTYF